MNHFQPTMLIVGMLGFGLHLFLRFRKDPEENFWLWLGRKENWTYGISGIALCGVGLIFAPQTMTFLGMTDEAIYSFGMCYGGGHSVAQFMEQKQATTEKRIAECKEVTEALDKPVP